MSSEWALERLADLADWLTDRSRSETVPYLNDSISADLRTLLSALSEAEKALEPFAKVADKFAEGGWDSWMQAYRAAGIGDSAYRNARTTLSKLRGEG